MNNHENLSEPCQFLEWDTEFFERRIARVVDTHLNAERMQAILEWCSDRRIECLYFPADLDERQTIRLAEEHGFHLVEVRLNYETSLKSWDPQTRPRQAEGLSVRPGSPQDVPAIQEIAKNSYVNSRFYFDENFSQAQWQNYYRAWVKKSFEGGAELALVAEAEGEILGYITGLVTGEKEGWYELTGVKEGSRRSGIGHELFRSGLDWYVQHGIEYLWVSTQGRNLPTQRMIQRHGFISRSCQLYYHKWFNV